MKSLLVLASLTVFSSAAQVFAPKSPSVPAPNANSPEDLPADTVVAIVDGRSFTVGDWKKLMAVLPPNMQQAARLNRKLFLEQYALMTRMAADAEKAKLDEQSPYKDSLAYQRAYILAMAQMNELSHTPVSLAEQQSYYEANQNRYAQAKVKDIYIKFNPNPPAQKDASGGNQLTESEAKVKAEKLLEQIRWGADFAQLAKESSDDATSAAKGGDFGPLIRRSDNIPEEIKKVVFSLKPGEVSKPLRQPGGFYIFRLEELTTRPFAEVKDEIFTDIQQSRAKQAVEAIRKSIKVEVKNEAFFAPPTAGLSRPPSTAPRPTEPNR